jgi:transposase
MKPYSIEFRQKIIEVYEKERLSRRKLAQRFCVSTNFVQKLLKQYGETGNIHPQPQGGSREPKLKREQLIDLIEIIETNNDATLEELCDLLDEKLQVRVSRATMGRITQKLNYSVKKNSLRRRKRKRKGSVTASGVLVKNSRY